MKKKLKDTKLFLWLRGFRRNSLNHTKWEKRINLEIPDRRFVGRKPTGAMRVITDNSAFQLRKTFTATIEIEWEEEIFEVTTIIVDEKGKEQLASGKHVKETFWSDPVEQDFTYGID
jgi:hypothetical protein